MTKRCPFRYVRTSPEIIQLRVILYARYPSSLRDAQPSREVGPDRDQRRKNVLKN